MTAVSGTNVLQTLEDMLARALELQTALETTQLHRDGVFNEITEGRLTLPTTLPSEETLSTMRKDWIPEVQERLKQILSMNLSCERLDRSLNEDLEKMKPLIECNITATDEERIHFYDPTLAEMIHNTNTVAQKVFKKIQEVHRTNGVLRERLVDTIQRLPDFDKWAYGIRECRGILPNTIQWAMAPVKLGTFVRSIGMPEKYPIPLTEASQKTARAMVASLYRETTAPTRSPFLAQTEELTRAMNARFVDSKERGLSEKTDMLAQRLKNITNSLKRMESTLKTSTALAAPLSELFKKKLLTIQATLKEPQFNKAVEDLRMLQKLYSDTLPKKFDPSDLSETTLAHLGFLNPSLKEQVQGVHHEVQRRLPTLYADQAWLEGVDLTSLEAIPDRIAALSAKLSA